MLAKRNTGYNYFFFVARGPGGSKAASSQEESEPEADDNLPTASTAQGNVRENKYDICIVCQAGKFFCFYVTCKVRCHILYNSNTIIE